VATRQYGPGGSFWFKKEEEEEGAGAGAERSEGDIRPRRRNWVEEQDHTGSRG